MPRLQDRLRPAFQVGDRRPPPGIVARDLEFRRSAPPRMKIPRPGISRWASAPRRLGTGLATGAPPKRAPRPALASTFTDPRPARSAGGLEARALLHLGRKTPAGGLPHSRARALRVVVDPPHLQRKSRPSTCATWSITRSIPTIALRPAEAAKRRWRSGGSGAQTVRTVMRGRRQVIGRCRHAASPGRPTGQRQVHRPAAAQVMGEIDARKPPLAVEPDAVIDADVVGACR